MRMLHVRTLCITAAQDFSPDGFHMQLAGLASSFRVESHSPLVFKHLPWYFSQITPRLYHGIKSVVMAQICEVFAVVYTYKMQILKFNYQRFL